MEILSSPFLAPLTFYPAPTTLFCLPRAVHVYAITPIPTACIASQPSLQPLHVLVICPNAARVFLKLRPSHITPFDIFNSNVFKKQRNLTLSSAFYWFLLKSIWPVNDISDIISKRKGLFLISTFWKRKLSLLEMNNAPISSELVKSRIGYPHHALPVNVPLLCHGVAKSWTRLSNFTSLTAHEFAHYMAISLQNYQKNYEKFTPSLNHFNFSESTWNVGLIIVKCFFWTWFPFRSSRNSVLMSGSYPPNSHGQRKGATSLPGPVQISLPENISCGQGGVGRLTFRPKTHSLRRWLWVVLPHEAWVPLSLWWNENKSFCRNHANLLTFNQHELPLHRTGKMYKLQSQSRKEMALLMTVLSHFSRVSNSLRPCGP